MSKLKLWRISQGIDQRTAAKRLKVSAAAVSGWETGRFPPCARNVKKLARLLGKSMADVAVACYPQSEVTA